MGRDVRIDIHNYAKMLQHAERGVRESTLSARNKVLIFGYRDACLRQGVCGHVRLIRVLGVLKLFGQLLKKDFDTVTRDDLEGLISHLLRAEPRYSPETVGTYKAVLKKFMTWVLQPNDFPTRTPPPMIAWITCHVRQRDRRQWQQRDFLTPEEAARVTESAKTARDRALISSTWETGCRISEIGNRQLKDLTPHPHGFLLDVTGKTGARTVLLVGSASYISAWLAVHPFRNNPDAPLWPIAHASTPQDHMRYAAMRKLFMVLFRRAGITKRPNPHGLRHSRTSHLAAGIMTEPQLKAFLGWRQDSRMLARYVHLTAADANNAILAEHGLAPATARRNPLTVYSCLRCHEHNTPSAAYCTRCSMPLAPTVAYQASAERADAHELLLQLYQVLVNEGRLDQAADHLHNAGLGRLLKQLATQGKGS